MTAGQARISCGEGGGDGGSEESDDAAPDEWRVLLEHVSHWFFHGMGVVFAESGTMLLSSGGFLDPLELASQSCFFVEGGSLVLPVSRRISGGLH